MPLTFFLFFIHFIVESATGDTETHGGWKPTKLLDRQEESESWQLELKSEQWRPVHKGP